MLRIAVQAKGRLYDETMSFLGESDIKLSAMKRSLLVQSSNFPLEVLFLRDDDIPQSVATGVADIGIVGENEFVEKNEDAEIIKRLGFSKCRLSLAMPKEMCIRDSYIALQSTSILTFDKSFGKHNVQATGVYEMLKDSYDLSLIHI